MEREPEFIPPPAELSADSKLQHYEELCQGRPEALFVLAGGVVKKGQPEHFKSGSYADTDVHGLISGGKARSIAAAELHHYFPDASIVAQSYVAREPVSNARIMAEEMIRLGVAQDSIMLAERSYSTFTELLEMIRLVTERGWRRVAIVTNEFQIPRAQAMLNHIFELHDPNGYSERPEIQAALAQFREQRDEIHITFVAAETVLPVRDPRYHSIIQKAKQSNAWNNRVESDTKGTHEIENGEYWKNPPDTLIKQ